QRGRILYTTPRIQSSWENCYLILIDLERTSRMCLVSQSDKRVVVVASILSYPGYFLSVASRRYSDGGPR
ncbi:hypothetical protein JMJ77_0008688, partial [Colletotrichum scovillei]